MSDTINLTISSAIETINIVTTEPENYQVNFYEVAVQS